MPSTDLRKRLASRGGYALQPFAFELAEAMVAAGIATADQATAMLEHFAANHDEWMRQQAERAAAVAERAAAVREAREALPWWRRWFGGS